MLVKITELSPSYYWPKVAIVIVTTCGHRHIRPIVPALQAGEDFDCPMCDDERLDTPASDSAH